MYNHEYELYKKINPGISITKYAIAKLTAKTYVKAFSPENLSSAFKKAGIYPFNSAVITPEQVAPSLILSNTLQSPALYVRHVCCLLCNIVKSQVRARVTVGIF